MIFPGETIVYKFVVPFATNNIERIVVSYKQNGDIVFEKAITSGFQEEDENKTSVSFALTQEEGLLFSDNMPFTIQCNVLTKSGSRHTSREMKSSSGIQYLREVMENGN